MLIVDKSLLFILSALFQLIRLKKSMACIIKWILIQILTPHPYPYSTPGGMALGKMFKLH